MRSEAVERQKNASGVRVVAASAKAKAEYAFGDSFQDLSDLQKQDYFNSMKTGEDRLKQGDVHMAAHVSRVGMGDGRLQRPERVNAAALPRLSKTP